MTTQVLLVDDHQIVRDGLRLILRQVTDLKVIAEAGTGQMALEKIKEIHPDLIIMDVQLQDIDGIELARQVLSQWPGIKILILSAFADPIGVSEAMRAGVNGYLLKFSAADELLRAIQTVMAGGTYLCPEAASSVVANLRKPANPTAEHSPNALSKREYEVLKLTAEGFRIKEIAAQLNISLKTVETHRTHLMAKLGCSSVVELTRYAVREGVVTL